MLAIGHVLRAFDEHLISRVQVAEYLQKIAHRAYRLNSNLLDVALLDQINKSACGGLHDGAGRNEQRWRAFPDRPQNFDEHAGIEQRLLLVVISFPANSRERSRFEGHRLLLERPSPRNVLPEFARLFGSPGGMSQGANKKRVRVIDVLGQVPGVHRTFAQVRKTNEILLPIKEIQAIRDDGGIRARFVFDRKHWDPSREPRAAVNRVRFRTLFDRRRSEVSGDKEVWYESDLVDRLGRQTPTVVDELANKFWRPNMGGLPISVLLTERGYRYYLANVPAPSYWHPLVANLAVMFYLSSITRYRPYAFDSALEGGYSWVVWDFVTTAAPQFLYVLASHVAQTEAVRPYADIRA